MGPETTINHELVTVARESRGMTQSELAERIGMSQARLSKIEAGLVPAPSGFLASVSRELRYPEGFFLRTGRAYGPGVSELFHRKRAAAGARDLKAIYAKLNVASIHIAQLLQAVDVPDVKIPQHDPDEFGNVQDIARAVRAAWRLPSGPVPDVISLLEDAGAIVVRFPFATRYVDAISWWVPGSPPLIFVNRDMPPDKERWSCAHELGHLVMHREARPEMEKEANLFASEFLTPAAELKPELEGLSNLNRLVAMKPFWRVSMQALLYRARQLGCINDSRYRYLWMKMAPYRQREPAEGDIAPDEPGTLQQLFEVHSQELGYTLDQVAELVTADPGDLRDWYGAALGGERLRVVR